jgi:hypothetical protein
VVVGRIHFYNVAADDLEAGETPQELLRLATREAPDLRRPRSGGCLHMLPDYLGR